MASPPDPLSRRERQIMDIIYRRTEASVADVVAELPDAPSYSAVRALMRILEEKGHLKHRQQAGKYIYMPRRSPRTARTSALRRLLHTFFDGSVEQAVAALLNDADTRLSREELDRLSAMIEASKRQGR